MQDSIHDEDEDRPSQVTVVVQAPETRESTPTKKILASLGAIAAIGELIHQIVRFFSG